MPWLTGASGGTQEMPLKSRQPTTSLWLRSARDNARRSDVFWRQRQAAGHANGPASLGVQPLHRRRIEP